MVNENMRTLELREGDVAVYDTIDVNDVVDTAISDSGIADKLAEIIEDINDLDDRISRIECDWNIIVEHMQETTSVLAESQSKITELVHTGINKVDDAMAEYKTAKDTIRRNILLSAMFAVASVAGVVVHFALR